MDYGVLIIRIMIAIVFIGHGTQKLFGWFGGYGVSGTGQWLESIGFRPGGKIWAVIAGLFELVGGVLFGIGYLLPVAAALIGVIMMDAILTVHLKNGFWIDKGGFEYNVFIIVIVIGIAIMGPGKYVLVSF
ncbi:DoxX family protein [Pullulanibacillus sp. KACC 23026]|uniref:DoxX family protein n=1 Tax=Pullulanibacillus sp. KACC 23026 TaxID=3028315 RepID=UPI0023B1A46E|nr:DoxX family protein [Pullulanibacillus sp. KACC 23026]WEG13710.1 DoxX family protein [Pullulanibacillus sp. KACC 23026]